MGSRGRPPAAVTLTESDREALQRWTRRHGTSQSLALRSKIVLACAEQRSNLDISTELGCSKATVSKWRLRFMQRGLDGMVDLPRSGAPRTITDNIVEAVLVDALETTPGEDTHWATRGMAAKHGISRETVGRIWRAFGLTPHVMDEFKISPDPLLIEKIRDIVGLYLSPPLNAACSRWTRNPRSRR